MKLHTICIYRSNLVATQTACTWTTEKGGYDDRRVLGFAEAELRGRPARSRHPHKHLLYLHPGTRYVLSVL